MRFSTNRSVATHATASGCHRRAPGVLHNIFRSFSSGCTLWLVSDSHVERHVVRIMELRLLQQAIRKYFTLTEMIMLIFIYFQMSILQKIWATTSNTTNTTTNASNSRKRYLIIQLLVRHLNHISSLLKLQYLWD